MLLQLALLAAAAAWRANGAVSDCYGPLPDVAAAEAAALVDTVLYPSLLTVASVCGANLTAYGTCSLPNLFTPLAVQQLLTHVASFKPTLSDKYHTITQMPIDESLPVEHPRNRLVHARIGFVGRRLLGEASPLVAFYHWDPFLDFVRAATNDILYRSADVDGSVYGTVNEEGYLTAWHIDQHPVSAVVLLQKAETGGAFQWVHGLVEEGPVAMDAEVPAILNGSSARIQASISEPGTLVLFRGSRTLHQVAAVQGPTPRISVVFAFAPSPDFRNSELVQQANKWE